MLFNCIPIISSRETRTFVHYSQCIQIHSMAQQIFTMFSLKREAMKESCVFGEGGS